MLPGGLALGGGAYPALAGLPLRGVGGCGVWFWTLWMLNVDVELPVVVGGGGPYDPEDDGGGGG